MSCCATISSPEAIHKRGMKRPFLDCSMDVSPIRFKKRKTFGYLDEIRNIKQSFTVHKLQFNKTLTQNAANDQSFNKQPSSKQSQYIRWVIACKFIIASGLKLDSYDVLGMNRHKIPQNMYFYVDDQKNLCAVIRDDGSNHISNNIMTQLRLLFCIFNVTYLAFKSLQSVAIRSRPQ
eukprot:696975_1